MLVAVCADRRIVPVTNWPLTVMVSATASPMVVLPVLLSVVNVPAAAAVPPIAGGLARYVLNPVPETVLDADSVVNAPVDAVDAPMLELLIVLLVSVWVTSIPTRVVVASGIV